MTAQTNRNIHSGNLSAEAIRTLENNGCSSRCWEQVLIHPDTDLSLLRNVRFEGEVKIGIVKSTEEALSGIGNALVIDCEIGDYPFINNIGGHLKGVRIGPHVTITNTGRVEMEPEARCGVCTAVSVLDETGSRPVYIFPGLSVQLATLMALRPQWTEEEPKDMITEACDRNKPRYDIGAGAVITDCGMLRNVRVDSRVTVEGATRLVNGTIVNNAPKGYELAFVGSGVDAENFIIEDGKADAGVLLRNVYIGQGAELSKRFTAHDSLFFANCAMENGEACAIIAAPYTVSMHKASLMIASQSSFMNAGSGTNFSNHMYKLGPVHWGYMERGVKTSSNAYVMWGARIGAFSLIMGNHKTHPDTSRLPFSYLFGDEKGRTTVAPAQMLKSCGLVRDAQKWPLRDKRLKRHLPLHDKINYAPYNPQTITSMMKGMAWLNEHTNDEVAADGLVHADGLMLRPGAFHSGRHLYLIAILRYLYTKMHTPGFEQIELGDSEREALLNIEWIDLAGMIMTRADVNRILHAGSLEEIDRILKEIHDNFPTKELKWVKALVEGPWKSLIPEASSAIVELEEMIAEDRRSYKESLAAENSQMAF